MEYFRIVNIRTSEEEIQNSFTLQNMESFSSLFFVINEQNTESAVIGGLWGEFTLKREIIKGGLRFSLLECPNALCWTITTGYPPDRESIVIHLTINRTRKAKEFTDEIEEFLNDHCECIGNFLKG